MSLALRLIRNLKFLLLMFSFRPIELRLSILETHADLSLDIISHIFSCLLLPISYETSVWYGKVKLILKLKQVGIFHEHLKFDLRHSNRQRLIHKLLVFT